MKKTLALISVSHFIGVLPAFAQESNLVEKVVKDFNLQEMGVRFLINVIAVLILVRLIYLKRHQNRDFMFTLILFNCVNFLICFLLSGANLGIGFAFGLFAIFSIMRYRTVTVPVKEMGYLFICIAMGLINSLATTQDHYIVLLLANASILVLPLLIDRPGPTITDEIIQLTQDIIYERIDLIKPERRNEMIEDLRHRTGLAIDKVEIISIDLMQDVATVKAYYCNSSVEMPSEGVYSFKSANGKAVLA